MVFHVEVYGNFVSGRFSESQVLGSGNQLKQNVSPLPIFNVQDLAKINNTFLMKMLTAWQFSLQLFAECQLLEKDSDNNIKYHSARSLFYRQLNFFFKCQFFQQTLH
jgi:hypothetical protein